MLRDTTNRGLYVRVGPEAVLAAHAPPPSAAAATARREPGSAPHTGTEFFEEEEEEEEEEEGLFRANAVNEEDPERDRATQV